MTDATHEVWASSWITPERMLRWSLGIVYLWFGALKLVGMSPVLGLVRSAYEPLGSVPLYIGLAIFELLLGVGLLVGFRRRLVAAAVVGHLLGTFGVLVSCPQVAFLPRFPFLTLEGEFVVKNLVLLAAAGTLWVGADRSVPATEAGPRLFRPVMLVVGVALFALAVAAGIVASRLHHAIRTASKPSDETVTSSPPTKLSARTVRELTEEAGGGSIVLEGVLVDRCPILGCWLKLRDESAEIVVDLAPKGLDVRGIAVGERVRVTGRIGKTREGTVGFVAYRIEPTPR